MATTGTAARSSIRRTAGSTAARCTRMPRAIGSKCAAISALRCSVAPRCGSACRRRRYNPRRYHRRTPRHDCPPPPDSHTRADRAARGLLELESAARAAGSAGRERRHDDAGGRAASAALAARRARGARRPAGHRHHVSASRRALRRRRHRSRRLSQPRGSGRRGAADGAQLRCRRYRPRRPSVARGDPRLPRAALRAAPRGRCAGGRRRRLRALTESPSQWSMPLRLVTPLPISAEIQSAARWRVRVAREGSCSFLEAHPAIFRSRPASGSLSTAKASARPLAARVTFLCSCKEKSPKESTVKQSIPRRTCTRTLRTDENSTQNSAVPGRTAFRFACDRRPECEANGVPSWNDRVVLGTFIRLQNFVQVLRGMLCFRGVSWLLLCTSKEVTRCPKDSGSFALVSKEVTRSACGRAEALTSASKRETPNRPTDARGLARACAQIPVMPRML